MPTLEQLFVDLTTALNTNTAELKVFNANKGKAEAPAKPGATVTPIKPAETVDFPKLKAAGAAVSKKHGSPAAKKIIKAVGGKDALAEVEPDKFAALHKAFEDSLKMDKLDADDGDDEL